MPANVIRHYLTKNIHYTLDEPCLAAIDHFYRLAEACGVTGVHANRTLRSLRERELMTFRDGVVTITNLPDLRRVAEFDPAYLYAGIGSIIGEIES